MSDRYDLVFAEGITLTSVNPDNNALKNSYIDNLICTSMAVFTSPAIINKVSTPRVVKGFISRKKLYDGEGKVTSNETKYAKGLALEITWPEFNSVTAVEIAKYFFDKSPTDFEIHIKNDSIAFYRGVKIRKVLRILEGEKNSVICKR